MNYPLSFLFVIFLIPAALTFFIFRFSVKYPGNHKALTFIIVAYIVVTIIIPILIGIYYYRIEVGTDDFSALLKIIATGRLLDTIGTRWPLVIKRLW